MKQYLKTAICLILILVESGYAQRVVSNNDKLDLRIKPTASAFASPKDVSVEFTLLNVSTDRVLAIKRASLHDLIYLDVVDESGSTVPWRGKIVSRSYPKDIFVVLEPAQSVTFSSTISFSNGDGYHFQKPGKFRVRAEFALSPKECFKPLSEGAYIPEHPIRSNWTTIVIDEAKAKH